MPCLHSGAIDQVRLVSLICGRGTCVPRGAQQLDPYSQLGLIWYFSHFVPTFFPDFIVLSHYFCVFLPLAPPILFPYARYPMWDTHLVHGIPVPEVHTRWYLVFWFFWVMFSRWVRTTLKPEHNNNNNNNNMPTLGFIPFRDHFSSTILPLLLISLCWILLPNSQYQMEHCIGLTAEALGGWVDHQNQIQSSQAVYYCR